MKSTSDRYGTVAVLVHWITALGVAILFLSGTRAADSDVATTKIGALGVHAPLGLGILAITLLRILWWRLADTKPALVPGMPRWQEIASHAVHGLLYLALVGMAGSGIGLFLQTGAGEIVLFGADRELPRFHDYTLRAIHGLGANLILALIAVHVAAALWHQFKLKDGLMRRMWFGRGRA